MQTGSYITAIIAMSRHTALRKNSSYRSQKKSRDISKYNNVLKRLKKLNANQQRQGISMANNALIRQFESRVKQLKQAKLSPIATKAFQRHRKAIRQLVNSRASISKRRTIPLQTCHRGRRDFYDFITSIPFLDPAIKYVDSL